MRTLGRAVAVALLGGLAGAAWIVLLYAFDPSVHLDMSRPMDRVTRGFHGLERDRDTGIAFAWTTRQADIDIPALDRRAEWQLVVRLRSLRPEPDRFPELTLAVDGVIVSIVQTTDEFVDVHAPIPARADLQRGARVTLTASNTFRPGPDDPRELGVMVEDVRIRPVPHPDRSTPGIALAPRPAIGGGLLVGLLMGGAFGLVGITAGSAVGAILALTAGHAAAVVRHLGPTLPFAYQVGWLALLVAVALVAGLRLTERAARGPLRNTARFAAVFTAGAAYLQLLVLLHPSAPASAAASPAWRLESVLEARYLAWTAVAPMGEVAWSTMVVLVAGLAGLLLYPAVVRSSGDRLAAAMAVAIYQLVQVRLLVGWAEHLTTAIGHSLAVLALVGVTAGGIERRSPARLAALTGLVTLAFVSDAAAFAVLLAALLGIAAAYRWIGGPLIRSAAGPLLGVTFAAAAAGALLWYDHLTAWYGEQGWRLLVSPPGGAAPRSVWALAGVAGETIGGAGVAPLLLACAGGAWMWRRRQADWLGLALFGWTAGCVALLPVVAVAVPPVDVRPALLPVVALLAAVGASWLWRAGRWARIACGILLALTVWQGVAAWLRPLL
jgi:hypothetical protein